MKNKNLIILLLLLSCLAALLIGRSLFFKPQTRLQLLTTIPALNQKNIPLNQVITLNFNQNINQKNLSIVSYPDFKYQLEKKEKNIVIKPEEDLTANTKYSLEIKDQDSSFYFNLIFFTKSEPTITPSPTPTGTKTGKGDPDAYQNMVKEISQNYPLFNKTPHQTENWLADYLEPKKLIVVYKKGTNLNLIKKEVFDWMKKESVDPATHQFEWQEQEK